MPDGWLSADEAARKLRVKPETLYAYVSRGLVRRERDPSGRRSRYLRADIERLAARQRGGGRAGGLEIIVETEVTRLDPDGGLAYRGWRIEDAAAAATFEETAAWLWLAHREAEDFTGTPALISAARAAIGSVGAAGLVDRVRIGVAAMRGADPLRNDRRAVAVARTGRAVIATILDALPVIGDEASPGSSVAARLWPILTRAAATPDDVRVLDVALILLADHELAASTLAARVAASTWADPYLVVQAGLAALGGPLHGGASEGARSLLADLHLRDLTPEEALGARLESGAAIPGFGHSVYNHGDPRAAILLEALNTRSAVTARAQQLLYTAQRLDLPLPNVDFALALLAEAYDMEPGSTELIFAIARITGWLAHAIEEYEHKLRFRPRAVYTGTDTS